MSRAPPDALNNPFLNASIAIQWHRLNNCGPYNALPVQVLWIICLFNGLVHFIRKRQVRIKHHPAKSWNP